METKVKALKDSLKKQKIKGLALDIDETLAFMASYWVKELSSKFGNPDGLSAREIFKKYRLIQNYPHWKSKEALAWMERARNTDEIQINMPLVENSNHIVNEINKIIPIVCYLTLRPEKVLNGTKAWLEKHGFPKAEILTRPHETDYESGTKWKAQVLDFLYPEVLGIVDDNPAILDYLPKNYKGYVFVFGRFFKHKGSINVISCKTWEDVLVGVKEKFISS